MSESTTTTTQEQKSRKGIGGPKTPEGKRRSKLNAFKTGIWAESYEGNKMVSEKIGVSFETVLQDMTANYHPADAEELVLVRRIARCTWRLLVLETMEDHILESTRLRKSPGKSLEQISVIERRTDVQLHRAIAALKAKKKADHENVKNELKEHRARREPSAEFSLIPRPRTPEQPEQAAPPPVQPALAFRPSPHPGTTMCQQPITTREAQHAGSRSHTPQGRFLN